MRLIFLNAFLALSITAFSQNGKLNDTTFRLTDQITNNIIKSSKNQGRHQLKATNLKVKRLRTIGMFLNLMPLLA